MPGHVPAPHAAACIEQLRVSTPTFLRGAAQSLRVELIRADGEHDVLGFRNGYVPNRAAIVVIGDSHTYGVGVRFAQTSVLPAIAEDC